MTERCPVHDIPDCSPLLNGCSRLLREEYQPQPGSGWSGGFEAGYRKATEDYEAKIRRVFEEMGIS